MKDNYYRYLFFIEIENYMETIVYLNKTIKDYTMIDSLGSYNNKYHPSKLIIHYTTDIFEKMDLFIEGLKEINGQSKVLVEVSRVRVFIQ